MFGRDWSASKAPLTYPHAPRGHYLTLLELFVVEEGMAACATNRVGKEKLCIKRRPLLPVHF